MRSSCRLRRRPPSPRRAGGGRRCGGPGRRAPRRRDGRRRSRARTTGFEYERAMPLPSPVAVNPGCAARLQVSSRSPGRRRSSSKAKSRSRASTGRTRRPLVAAVLEVRVVEVHRPRCGEARQGDHARGARRAARASAARSARSGRGGSCRTAARSRRRCGRAAMAITPALFISTSSLSPVRSRIARRAARTDASSVRSSADELGRRPGDRFDASRAIGPFGGAAGEEHAAPCRRAPRRCAGRAPSSPR